TYFILLARPLFMNCANLVQLILITVISELSTLVIVLINFNEISISGLILNIFFVPLFSFIIFPSVIVYNILLFFHVPPAIDMLYHFLFTLIIDSIYYLVLLFNIFIICCIIFIIFFVPFFSFIIFPSVIVYNILLFFHVPPAIDMLYHFLYTLMKDSIYYLAGAFKHRFPVKNLPDVSIIIMLFLTYRLSVHVLAFKLKKIISCILVFLLVLFLSQQHLNRDFTLTMVDVGQGDAFVIQDHQNKKTVLLDTGGTYQHNENRINLSDKTLLPYLKEQGVDFIDVIIISHLDLDHSGEVLNILSKKNVGNIIMNTGDVKFDDWLKTVSYEH